MLSKLTIEYIYIYIYIYIIDYIHHFKYSINVIYKETYIMKPLNIIQMVFNAWIT